MLDPHLGLRRSLLPRPVPPNLLHLPHFNTHAPPTAKLHPQDSNGSGGQPGPQGFVKLCS